MNTTPLFTLISILAFKNKFPFVSTRNLFVYVQYNQQIYDEFPL